MPELPEVETTRRGLSEPLVGARVSDVVVRNPRLRLPVPPELALHLSGQVLLGIDRRAKYLLFRFEHGSLIAHLGMSGSLRVCAADEPPGAHDHVDLVFGPRVLRYRDPRRFGLLQWWPAGTPEPGLLAHLGLEPLSDTFGGRWLHRVTRGRRAPIKLVLMDGHLLVGVGNIYASESLFRARIHPATPAGELGPARCARLADSVRTTLEEAIATGGSTLRDFVGGDGKPGYFQQSHAVYGRQGQPCPVCGTPVAKMIQGQRASFYCPRCQPPAR